MTQVQRPLPSDRWLNAALRHTGIDDVLVGLPIRWMTSPSTPATLDPEPWQATNLLSPSLAPETSSPNSRNSPGEKNPHRWVLLPVACWDPVPSHKYCRLLFLEAAVHDCPLLLPLHLGIGKGG
jgi:hypothetical protein